MDIKNFLFIDIGTEFLKTFIGEANENSINLINYKNFPSEGFRNGKISDFLNFKKSLQNIFNDDELSSFTEVVLCLGGFDIHSVNMDESIIVKDVIDNKDFESLFKNYLSKITLTGYEPLMLYAPRVFINDIEIFHNPLGEVGGKLRAKGNLFVIKNEMYENINEIKNMFLDKNIYTIPNCLISYEIFKKYEYIENTAIIDIGAGTTDICLIKDNRLIAGYSLGVGSEYITNDIMQTLELDFVEAENLKKYFSKIDNKIKGQGIVVDCSNDENNPKNVQYDFIYEIIDCRVNDIIELIKTTIEQQFKGFLNNIFLLGDGVLLYNFEEKLKVAFNLPMKCGNIKELPNISVNLDILGLKFRVRKEADNLEGKLNKEPKGLGAKFKSFFKM